MQTGKFNRKQYKNYRLKCICVVCMCEKCYLRRDGALFRPQREEDVNVGVVIPIGCT